MAEIKAELDAHGMGAFNLYEDGVKQGEMVVSVKNNTLTVYHTEVSAENEGKGLARYLLAGMVAYARERRLNVSPLCPFVLARFKRHREEYADVWAGE
jgi:predicted GNAT family acetyltransferase